MPNSLPAKKSLGQCFLVERSYAARIASALGIQSSDTVVEVGPGRGILTEELLKSGAQTIAIEIDQRLLTPLLEKFGENPNFSLHHEDFLAVDLESLLTYTIYVSLAMPLKSLESIKTSRLPLKKTVFS